MAMLTGHARGADARPQSVKRGASTGLAPGYSSKDIARNAGTAGPTRLGCATSNERVCAPAFWWSGQCGHQWCALTLVFAISERQLAHASTLTRNIPANYPGCIIAETFLFHTFTGDPWPWQQQTSHVASSHASGDTAPDTSNRGRTSSSAVEDRPQQRSAYVDRNDEDSLIPRALKAVGKLLVMSHCIFLGWGADETARHLGLSSKSTAIATQHHATGLRKRITFLPSTAPRRACADPSLPYCVSGPCIPGLSEFISETVPAAHGQPDERDRTE
jgi:hypothetical protein